MVLFTQLNLHKAKQAGILAGQNMEGKDNFISLLTEPHLVYNKLHGFPRGTQIIYDNTIPKHKPGPRAAIVCSRELTMTALPQWSGRDCAAAILRLDKEYIIVASVYLDIRTSPRPAWLEALLDMAATKDYPLILGIDSNAHSTLYGPNNNARGDEIEDLIIQHGLEVENKGNTPTFEIKRGRNLVATHIDITLSRGLTDRINQWQVNQEYNASDHNTIQYTLTCPRNTEKTYIRPWSKADWGLFTKYLAEADYKMPDKMNMKKLDRTLEKVY